MRVLFLNGPSQDSCDRFFGWPTSLLYAVAPTVNAIRDGSLRASLVPTIFDPIWFVEERNGAEVRAEFRKSLAGVTVILASVTYDSLHPTLELLRAAKAAKNPPVTILGGPHIDEIHMLSQMGEIISPESPVDVAVAGDGEYALLRLLCNLADGKPILDRVEECDGCAWVCAKGYEVSAKTTGKQLDLDGLPFLPIHLADQSRHRHDFDIFKSASGTPLPTVQMIAQRGCRYDCSFCSESKHLSPTNARSVANVVEEIQLRKREGFRAVFFDDSTFGARSDLVDFLTALSATGMAFGCLNRFNHIDNQERVAKYKDAGFVYFYCAIEQYDDEVLRRMNKRITTSAMHKAMLALKRNGIALGVSLLYGLPYETRASVAATLDFVEHWVNEGVIHLVSESVFTLHPGTAAGKSLVAPFDRPPPHTGFPFDRFEEGQWYHAPNVSHAYLERISEMSQKRFGGVLVRNRHSWYRKHGLLITDPEAKGETLLARTHSLAETLRRRAK